MSLLRHLGNVKLRICLSSRHHPNFPDHDCRQIWVEDNNHGDIERYIRDRLGEDYTLEAKPSGVFLWVVLIIPELAAKIHGLTAKRRKKLIRELPPELDDIYKRQLDSVQEKNDPQALAIIRWVLFSLRPLRLSELRSVLGFSSETPCRSLEEWHSSDEFPDSSKIMFHLLQDLSDGLLETRGMREDHDADTDLEVQLIHESVRDFLIRSNGVRLLGFTNSTLNDAVHEELKRFCIHYLTVSELRTGFWDLEEDNANFPVPRVCMSVFTTARLKCRSRRRLARTNIPTARPPQRPDILLENHQRWGRIYCGTGEPKHHYCLTGQASRCPRRRRSFRAHVL